VSDTPPEWSRLHPLSPLVLFGTIAVTATAAAAPVIASEHNRLIGGIVEGTLLLLGLIGCTVSWLVTRWRIRDDELQLETGLLRRQSIRLPLKRIQSVDVVRPVLARALGLAELRVQVAGAGTSRGRLTYLPEGEAVRLRGTLLALAHGLTADTPAPPELPAFAVRNERLVAGTLLSFGFAYLVALAVGALLTLVFTRSVEAFLAWAGILIPVTTMLWHRFNSEFSFVIAQAPDGLRVTTGLLTTRHETIPSGRIQAVRWLEPLPWRLFGWCRLEVDVARQRAGARGGDNTDTNAVNRALLPVGTRAEAVALLGRVLPGVDVRAALAAHPPRRARAKAPWSYHRLGAVHDDWYLVTADGRVRQRFVIVPLAKVQSFRLVQGPLARRFGLVTLHADLVGRRWTAAARCRDAHEGRALFETLAAQARVARQASRAETT
jgi:putative membrane protein